MMYIRVLPDRVVHSEPMKMCTPSPRMYIRVLPDRVVHCTS